MSSRLLLCIGIGFSVLVGCGGASDADSGATDDHLETKPSEKAATASSHSQAVAACDSARDKTSGGGDEEMQIGLRDWNDCLVAADDAVVPRFPERGTKRRDPLPKQLAALRESAQLTCAALFPVDGQPTGEELIDSLNCTGAHEHLLAVLVDAYGFADLGSVAVPLPYASKEHPACAEQFAAWERVRARGTMKSVDMESTDAERLLSICLLKEIDTLAPAASGEKRLGQKVSLSWSATIDGLCSRFARDDSFDDTQDAQRARFAANACILDREAESFRMFRGLLGAPGK